MANNVRPDLFCRACGTSIRSGRNALIAWKVRERRYRARGPRARKEDLCGAMMILSCAARTNRNPGKGFGGHEALRAQEKKGPVELDDVGAKVRGGHADTYISEVIALKISRSRGFDPVDLYSQQARKLTGRTGRERPSPTS